MLSKSWILHSAEYIVVKTTIIHVDMMTSSNGNIIRFTGPLCGASVNSQHKTQWRGALMFSLICAWINGSVNNCKAGDLGCHRAHYDFIVMDKEIPDLCNLPTLFNSNGLRNLWAKHYCQASSTLDMNLEVSIIKLLWGSESNNLQKFCPLQWSFNLQTACSLEVTDLDNLDTGNLRPPSKIIP